MRGGGRVAYDATQPLSILRISYISKYPTSVYSVHEPILSLLMVNQVHSVFDNKRTYHIDTQNATFVPRHTQKNDRG